MRGLWLSVVVHVMLGSGLMAVVPSKPSEEAERKPKSIRVFTLPPSEAVAIPERPKPIAAPRLPAPLPPPPRPVQQHAVIPEIPKAAVIAPIVTKPIAPAPTVLPPAAPVFERPAEPVVERAPETGLFERSNSSRAAQQVAAVTTGGFGAVGSSPRGSAYGSGAVTTGGFGTVAASPRGTASAGGEVQTSGFERRASAPAQAATLPKAIDKPVEIISKPSPEYTEEARSARIEGTVTLELEFTATGEVRVLRVVRGLGHGLDEAAERAAVRIRFKPAQTSDGRPVDSRATVHITFRLS